MTKRFTDRLPCLLLAGALAGAATHAAADTPVWQSSRLDLGGYATAAITHSNSDQAEFVRYNQAAGATTGYLARTDSNLGLQASYRLSEDLSATAQLVTRQSTKSHFSTDLAWAFVRVKLADELHLRLGRVVLPIFMMSDSQNIGYANTMVRPPIEMYALAALENVDGADLSYRRMVGDTNLTVQLVGGTSRGELLASGGAGAVLSYRAPSYALNLALEHGPLTLRLSRLTTTLNANFGPLDTLTGYVAAAGYPQLAQQLSLADGKRFNFTSVGLALDHNNWLLQSEYGWRRATEPAYVPDNNAWYLMAGYRSGNWLPYAAHASVRQQGRSITLPANFPRDGALYRAVDYNLLTAGEQNSDLIGVRWNFAPSRALKLQVDHVRPTAKNGVLIQGPANGLKSAVTVVALALDVVF